MRITRYLSVLLAVCFLFGVCTTSSLAYTSPFSSPDPTEPGEVNQPAAIKYTLREGGTFLYCNNPEKVTAENLGKALMIENDIHGEIYFTCENNNQAKQKALFGLQLRNNSGETIKVTVKNIGYQSGYDWFGQREWSDFFQTDFELDNTSGNYAFKSVYNHSSFTETTYTIPNGKYFYVMGGSTKDAYQHINVGGSADKYISYNTLVDATVDFVVDGPETGVSVAYVYYLSGDDPVTTTEQQGYVVEMSGESYGRQYLGSAPYLCVDASMAWNIDDSFKSGSRLKVSYPSTTYLSPSTTAYGTNKNPSTRTINSTSWTTHINPQSNNAAVGTDMVPFYCVTAEDGSSVVIDIQHADGTGKQANIGNWMIIYEESLTFQNSGTKPRKFSYYTENNGFLAFNVLDSDGNVLRSVYHSNNSLPVYTFYVDAGQTVTVTMEYVLLADSYGNVLHYIVAEDMTDSEIAKMKGTLVGDVDGNETVEAKDYLKLKRFVLGTYEATEEEQNRMDVNYDGQVSAKDYIMLKRVVLGTYSF